MHDVIVVGVGGMGSSTLFHLADSGARVLGLEQYGVPHAYGSSHGSTRIIRLAYYEGAEYVPLLRAAYQYWRELEGVAGEEILRVTGGLDIGPPGSRTVRGSKQSCLRNGLHFEELGGRQASRRFGGYDLPESLRAIYQPDGGFLMSERAVAAYAKAAVGRGAELLAGVRVSRWERSGSGIVVHADHGSFTAQKLVLTAGAWTGELGPAIRSWCRPERQVMLWTEPLTSDLFSPQRFPVFNMESPLGRFYGVPNHGGEGFKVGKFHHLKQSLASPSELNRECGEEDEEVLRDAVRKYFPLADGPTRRMVACMFTNTPDEHFILDRYPGQRDVFVAAGFSGHGFKFCSVVGRVMADLCLGIEPRWDLQRFRAERFSE